ncbi:hypothetical protein B9Z19DRAFT_1125370 [Tuber borchii]|uniref:Insertion element IS150 protein InsJ-like helix-turn-helix domain-containing protein n=1 Tax=Tuber borchii TaxID=42251 RepID=A0A2T6ZV49_TUBBO|nr:hypothetical protein B9Z19DRAFT_1125370 [Tuber borchii]
MPKDPTTGKRREATLVERVKVIEKHAAGKSYRAIGEEIGISKSEAQRIIQRWKEFEELKPRPRTGRPSKYPPGETRAERRRKHRLAKKLADAEKMKAGADGEVGSSAVGSGNSVQVPMMSLTMGGQNLRDDPPSCISSPVPTVMLGMSSNEGEDSGREGSNEAEDGVPNMQAESEETTNQNSPAELVQ